LRNAVYLVVREAPGLKDEPIGTAFALDSSHLATNARKTQSDRRDVLAARAQ
jgi:hypothetical protein